MQAVRQIKPDARGPILCFIGPPGVGKTSLARSIASALGRKFERISLGGVHDEAEIRGHRRTYIGSMPGRVLQGLKKVGVNDPLLLLDEIDKLGRDVRGDPASALLEVLDPEQNTTIMDHFLIVPVDLSKIFFVASANRGDTIPPALLDRLEVVELDGYTEEEKMDIGRRHLLPKLMEDHGLPKDSIEISPEIMRELIRSYTREAGVRHLQRQLASLCRTAALKMANKLNAANESRDVHSEEDSVALVEIDKWIMSFSALEEVLGPPKYDFNDGARRVSTPGVCTGLVWTAAGGLIQYIESSVVRGRGEKDLVIMTGHLGDVIKESATIALSWLRAHSWELNLDSQLDDLERNQVHIHLPAGKSTALLPCLLVHYTFHYRCPYVFLRMPQALSQKTARVLVLLWLHLLCLS